MVGDKMNKLFAPFNVTLPATENVLVPKLVRLPLEPVNELFTVPPPAPAPKVAPDGRFSPPLTEAMSKVLPPATNKPPPLAIKPDVPKDKVPAPVSVRMPLVIYPLIVRVFALTVT